MDKLTNFDKYIKENEALVAVGFGTPASSASWSMAGLRGGDTGYSFQPVAGRVKDLAMGIAQQGLDYEGNENPNHSGVEYIKEAKNHIGNHIDETYDAMKGKDTRERVTEEYIELIDGKGDIGAGIEMIKDAWLHWKNGPMTEPKHIRPAKKELIDYITQWLNKDIK
jgi:hypothetical protein|tara:strand:- start:747 stop:1247 length:501 start_codon:yes stop_codon:yes gene_type:complete